MATLKEFEDALREQGMHMALAILESLRQRDRAKRSVAPARRVTARKMTPELARRILELHGSTKMTQQEIAFQLGVNQARRQSERTRSAGSRQGRRSHQGGQDEGFCKQAQPRSAAAIERCRQGAGARPRAIEFRQPLKQARRAAAAGRKTGGQPRQRMLPRGPSRV